MINDFNFGRIAQLVERWIEDPSVGGSIPSSPTIQELGVIVTYFKGIIAKVSYRSKGRRAVI